MNIGFIGAGKAGTALGRYLVDHNHTVVGYASASYTSAQSAASFTQSSAFASNIELVQASDLVFITTPDGVISSVWHELLDAHHAGSLSLTSKLVFHCSGCCSSKVFVNAHDVGVWVGSAHPLLAFGNKETAHVQVASAHFSVEGDARALEVVVPLLKSLGNTVHVLNAADKNRYHAAAVFASNLVLAPLDTAVKLLEQCGFSEVDARAALKPLVCENIENFFHLGAPGALTGPVERADLSTVENHLQVLDSNQTALYCVLTQILIEIAKQKHPNRTYEGWTEVLDKEKENYKCR